MVLAEERFYCFLFPILLTSLLYGKTLSINEIEWECGSLKRTSQKKIIIEDEILIEKILLIKNEKGDESHKTGFIRFSSTFIKQWQRKKNHKNSCVSAVSNYYTLFCCCDILSGGFWKFSFSQIKMLLWVRMRCVRSWLIAAMKTLWLIFSGFY